MDLRAVCLVRAIASDEDEAVRLIEYVMVDEDAMAGWLLMDAEMECVDGDGSGKWKSSGGVGDLL